MAFNGIDWASCYDDRKTTKAYCVFLGDSLVSWHSNQHKVISHYITKFEHRDVAMASTELLWLRALIIEIGVSLSSPPIILCDNLSATYLSHNPIFHALNKHIEIHFHFLYSLV